MIIDTVHAVKLTAIGERSEKAASYPLKNIERQSLPLSGTQGSILHPPETLDEAIAQMEKNFPYV